MFVFGSKHLNSLMHKERIKNTFFPVFRGVVLSNVYRLANNLRYIFLHFLKTGGDLT